MSISISRIFVKMFNFTNFLIIFRLDHDPGVNVTCGSVTKLEQLAGDFSSDAQFFVFTGVLSFLGTMACLVVYLFFPEMYYNENKKAPMFVSTT